MNIAYYADLTRLPDIDMDMTIINPTTEYDSIQAYINTPDLSNYTLLFEGMDISIDGRPLDVPTLMPNDNISYFYSNTNLPLEEMDREIAEIILSSYSEDIIFVATPTPVETKVGVDRYLSKVPNRYDVQYGERVPRDVSVLIDTMRTWRLHRTAFGGSSIDITYRTSSEADSVTRRDGLQDVYRMCTPIIFNTLKESYPKLIGSNKLGPQLLRVLSKYDGPYLPIIGLLLILERCDVLYTVGGGTKPERLQYTKASLMRYAGSDSVESYTNLLLDMINNIDNAREWSSVVGVRYEYVRDILDVLTTLERVDEEFDREDFLFRVRMALVDVFSDSIVSTISNGSYILNGIELTFNELYIPSAIESIRPETIVVMRSLDRFIILAAILPSSDVSINVERSMVNYVPGRLDEDIVELTGT